ncbi:hypothetical protein DFR67_11113 [Williamsia limnetica]|uniref:Phosphodiesterase n=1 Tax=Williamsia limnetica TaxID=882452 RepID=A0A318REA8_WILLI|nr:phosphodiesterase [Williamsia limnetica]PYE14939.1 hypothetical protein DFR67_11113 [Williamsia limnetica]
MKAADLAGLPIKAGAALRGARLFHPNGVLATGTIIRTASDGVGLPVETGPVLARLSKGVGIPGGLPDVVGLAIRMEPHAGDSTPWDLLLASALGGSGWRKTIPFPARSLGSAVLSTLQPLDHDGSSWWLRATLATRPDGYNPSLSEIAHGIDNGGLVFEIEQTQGHTPFLPLARVELTAAASDSEHPDIGFDPTVNTTRNVRPGPSWLSSIREVAYRNSRQGRDAES